MSDAQSPPPPPPNLPHDSLKTNIFVSSGICWAIAAFFVGLRFYTRGAIIRVLGSSDWSVLVALVGFDEHLGMLTGETSADPVQVFAGATCAAVIERLYYQLVSFVSLF
jgi:hypothetical protein